MRFQSILGCKRTESIIKDFIGLSSLMHGLPDHIVSFNRIGAFLQSASDGGPVRCIAKEDNGLYQCVFQALTSEELEHYKTIRAHGGRMASIDFVTSNLSSSIACASVVDHAIDEDVKVGEAFTSDGVTDDFYSSRFEARAALVSNRRDIGQFFESPSFLEIKGVAPTGIWHFRLGHVHPRAVTETLKRSLFYGREFFR